MNQLGTRTIALRFKGFGDAAFALAPDSIGLAPGDSTATPYGWYVIQRVE